MSITPRDGCVPRDVEVGWDLTRLVNYFMRV